MGSGWWVTGGLNWCEGGQEGFEGVGGWGCDEPVAVNRGCRILLHDTLTNVGQCCEEVLDFVGPDTWSSALQCITKWLAAQQEQRCPFCRRPWEFKSADTPMSEATAVQNPVSRQ